MYFIFGIKFAKVGGGIRFINRKGSNMKFLKAFVACATFLVAANSNAALINFNDYSIEGFAGQDVNGTSTVSDFGLTLDLDGNTWVSISNAFDFVIDPTSVLYFSFEASGNEAEWYGIGFDNNDRVTASSLFQFGGTDTTSANQLTQYSFGSGVATYAVNVGDFLTGAFSKMIFVLDADNVSGTSASFFDVELCSSASFCETTSQSNVSVNAPSSTLLMLLSLGLLATRIRRS